MIKIVKLQFVWCAEKAEIVVNIGDLVSFAKEKRKQWRKCMPVIGSTTLKPNFSHATIYYSRV